MASEREILICKNCGEIFVSLVRLHRKFCSKECSNSYQKMRVNENE
ncbi:MAG TPA: hypothetical protein VMZ29_09260 [Candidatus Bathyarchaeia archaeon]|nr:hypothetical protein [Candidatus Bathyarchaeia archaeon]